MHSSRVRDVATRSAGDAGVQEQRPQEHDELAAALQGLDVALDVVRRREVEHHLRPELRQELPHRLFAFFLPFILFAPGVSSLILPFRLFLPSNLFPPAASRALSPCSAPRWSSDREIQPDVHMRLTLTRHDCSCTPLRRAPSPPCSLRSGGVVWEQVWSGCHQVRTVPRQAIGDGHVGGRR